MCKVRAILQGSNMPAFTVAISSKSLLSSSLSRLWLAVPVFRGFFGASGREETYKPIPNPDNAATLSEAIHKRNFCVEVGGNMLMLCYLLNHNFCLTIMRSTSTGTKCCEFSVENIEIVVFWPLRIPDVLGDS